MLWYIRTEHIGDAICLSYVIVHVKQKSNIKSFRVLGDQSRGSASPVVLKKDVENMEKGKQCSFESPPIFKSNIQNQKKVQCIVGFHVEGVSVVTYN